MHSTIVPLYAFNHVVNLYSCTVYHHVYVYGESVIEERTERQQFYIELGF